MKKLFVLALLAFAGHPMMAQDGSSPATPPSSNAPHEAWYNRLVYGGNLGLQFGNPTLVDLSPTVGYKITDKLIAGVGVSYQYIGYRYYGQQYKQTIWGYSGFARYYILDNLFAHAECDRLYSHWRPYNHPDVPYWITGLLVGGGYRQNLGGVMSVSLMVLWKVNKDDAYDWPYSNPIIRAGIGFGL